MRSKVDSEWKERISLHVPHLFAGSVHDVLVKPNQAHDGCNEVLFTSTEMSKRGLGHSHLNSEPDPKLIEVLRRHSYYFLSSGFVGSAPQRQRPLTDAIHRNIEIVFSRSALKLEAARKSAGELITAPWAHAEFDRIDRGFWDKFGDSVTVEFQGSSVNYLRRHAELVGLPQNNEVTTRCLDLVDPFGFDDLNEMICEVAFEPFKLGSNPYASVGIDINDFPKRSLIYNEDFADLFLGNVHKRGLKIGAQNYEKTLNSIYVMALNQYRMRIVKQLYDDMLNREEALGLYLFENMIFKIVRKVRGLPEKTNEYRTIYGVIKKVLIKFKVKIDIRKIECLVAKLFRSDGYSYRLDRDINYIFQKDGNISYKNSY
jgi:hypothetical protein